MKHRLRDNVFQSTSRSKSGENVLLHLKLCMNLVLRLQMIIQHMWLKKFRKLNKRVSIYICYFCAYSWQSVPDLSRNSMPNKKWFCRWCFGSL